MNYLNRLVPFLLLIPGLSFADVYKCKSDNGSLTFSDTPCSDHAEKIDVNVSTPANNTSTAKGNTIVGKWSSGIHKYDCLEMNNFMMDNSSYGAVVAGL